MATAARLASAQGSLLPRMLDADGRAGIDVAQRDIGVGFFVLRRVASSIASSRRSQVRARGPVDRDLETDAGVVAHHGLRALVVQIEVSISTQQ